MTASRSITLYTSIPPSIRRVAGGVEYGETYQHECINSWISAGFRVVSLNRRSELLSLAHKFPQVAFTDSGAEDARTRMDIFFQKIVTSGEEMAAIINADCYVVHQPSICNILRNGNPGTMTLFRRLNVDSSTMRPIGMPSPGFDGFLFDVNLLRLISGGEHWQIGEPWWDYWFPIEMALAGAKMHLVDIPVFLHLDHDQRWDEKEDEVKADFFWQILQQAREFRGVGLPNGKSRSVQLSTLLPSWLHNQSEIIQLTADGLSGNFFSKFLLGLEGSQEASLRHQLETVTFPKWLRSKRGAAWRFAARIRRSLQFARTA